MEVIGLIAIVAFAWQMIQFLGEDPRGFMKAWLQTGLLVLSCGLLFYLLYITGGNWGLGMVLAFPWVLGTYYLLGKIGL